MAPLTPFKKAPYGIVPVSDVVVDYDRDKKLTPFSLKKLDAGYLRGLPSPQDRFAQVAAYYAYDKDHAQRLYDRISRLHFMPATPILSNGGTPHGLPASCFVNEAQDTLEGLSDFYRENMFMAARGGGIGSYWGNLRSLNETVGKNGHTSGVIPFIHVMDSLTLAISQGCVDGDTEVLTEKGFVKFSELTEAHGRVWQIDQKGVSTLVTVEEYHEYDYTGELHRYITTDRHGEVVLDQLVTPSHRMIKTNKSYLMDKLFSDFEAVQSQDVDLTEKASFIKLHPDQCDNIVQGKWVSHDLVSFANTTRDSVPFTGKVYCVNVPSGMVIVRKNGTICVSGNSLRRGSAAVYLPIWHPEIEEFIEMRRPTGGDLNRKNQNLHHGVVIPNAFMREVLRDGEWELRSPKTGEVIRTISARSLWIRLLTARMEQGEPYILYSDNIIENMPGYQRELGLTVKTSNLCVRGDTLIRTIDGDKPIETLAGKEVELWNGRCFSLSRVEKTSDSEVMRRIEFSNGKSITCTDAHEFDIQRNHEVVRVAAKELTVGTKLADWHIPESGVHQQAHVTGIVENVETGPTYCANEPMFHSILLNGVLTGNCSEITLPTGLDHHGKERTAVCFLCSPNLETYDEWKDDPLYFDDLYYFMDAVVQDLIDNAPPQLVNAAYGAMRERAIGVGVMGWHSFLQQRHVPFESVIAKSWNKKIFKTFRENADRCSRMIAEQRGPCPDAADAGVMERFTCKIAVAPTASISIVCGEASPGIDPITANVYNQKTLTGTEEVKNKYLVNHLQSLGMNTEEVWSSIRNNSGSVHHLEFLSDHDKAVFSTAFEIDPRWIIEHAADRTPYICQSQPVNLFLPANIHKADLHAIHMLAWEMGLKSLYYCRSLSIQRADSITGSVLGYTLAQESPVKYDECLSCQ